MPKVFKKKDLDKKKSIDELVDEKGGRLQGAEKVDQSDKTTTTKDTTDDHVQKSRQGMARYMYRSFYGEDDQSKEPESLEEMAKDKMKGVLENIFKKKDFNNADILDKIKYSNGIPEIDTIKEKYPVIIRKISHLKSLLESDEIEGEDKAIMLNALLSINLTDVSPQYKKELTRKLS